MDQKQRIWINKLAQVIANKPFAKNPVADEQYRKDGYFRMRMDSATQLAQTIYNYITGEK